MLTLVCKSSIKASVLENMCYDVLPNMFESIKLIKLQCMWHQVFSTFIKDTYILAEQVGMHQ